MQRLELTLPAASANIALDDALLRHAPAGGLLRIWEPLFPFVVLGRGSRAADEARLEVCRREMVPVIRRVSGGAAILAGPGCLMYALVMDRTACGASVESMHRQILKPLADALAECGVSVAPAGTSDLVLTAPAGGARDLGPAGRKVSGNSLRLTRNHLLYHGTLLYGFDLARVSRYLRMPPRMPTYRAGRDHFQFLANLPLTGAQARQVLRQAWGAGEMVRDWPAHTTRQLEREKYLRDTWNLRC